mgnify:FL=1
MHCADKEQVLNLLKTTRGQIECINRMLEDDRYCVDNSKQIFSVQALLKKANLRIIDQHIRNCVKEAFIQGDNAGNAKVDEIINLIDKYVK